MKSNLRTSGMSTLKNQNEEEIGYFLAMDVSFTEDFICLTMSDGREIRTPLLFYPRLKNATLPQRKNFQIIGLGTGIHWPDLDEDLSVKGIVLGLKSVF